MPTWVFVQKIGMRCEPAAYKNRYITRYSQRRSSDVETPQADADALQIHFPVTSFRYTKRSSSMRCYRIVILYIHVLTCNKYMTLNPEVLLKLLCYLPVGVVKVPPIFSGDNIKLMHVTSESIGKVKFVSDDRFFFVSIVD